MKIEKFNDKIYLIDGKYHMLHKRNGKEYYLPAILLERGKRKKVFVASTGYLEDAK